MPAASEADASGPEQDLQSSMTFRNRVLDELPGRRPADKAVSAEVRLVILVNVVVVHRSAGSRIIFTVYCAAPSERARWHRSIYIQTLSESS